MKNMTFALAIAAMGATALLTATPASAEANYSCPTWRCGFNGPSQNGINLNGFNLNGWNLNGMRMNGVAANGKVLQGVSLNGKVLQGVALNGKVLQGFNLNGMRMNGVGDKAVQPSVVACEGKGVGPCKPGVVAITLPSGERLAID